MIHTCHSCGANVTCNIQRMSPKGEGAWYAYKIRKLGPMRALILEIMQARPARSWASGLSSKLIGHEVREAQKHRGLRLTNDHSIGGRVSELQGLGLIESSRGEVELKDQVEQKYVTTIQARYYLTEIGLMAPHIPDWNPNEAVQ